MRSSTADSGVFPIQLGEHPVVPGDAEQAEPDDEEARHRARAERDLERRLQPLARSLGRAHVRAHGDVHADEAGRRREDGADEEAERRAPPELVVEAEQEERHDRDDRDRRVLLAQVRRGALLDRARDLLHLLVPGRLLEQPPGEVQPVQNRHGRTRKREPDGVIYEEVHGPPVLLLSRRKVRRVSDPDFSALRPSQSERRVAPARPIMYHKAREGASASTGASLRHRFRVRELEVRARLLEVADDRLVHAAVAQHRARARAATRSRAAPARDRAPRATRGGTRSTRRPRARSGGCPRRRSRRAPRGAPPRSGAAARQPPIVSVARTCSA